MNACVIRFCTANGHLPAVPQGPFVLEHLLASVEEDEAEEEVHHPQHTHPADCREEDQEQRHPEEVLEHKYLGGGRKENRLSHMHILYTESSCTVY